jgi:hypothetical protein
MGGCGSSIELVVELSPTEELPLGGKSRSSDGARPSSPTNSKAGGLRDCWLLADTLAFIVIVIHAEKIEERVFFLKNK